MSIFNPSPSGSSHRVLTCGASQRGRHATGCGSLALKKEGSFFSCLLEWWKIITELG